MRAWICRKCLLRFEKKLPGWFRRVELQILMNATARAFGVPGKRIRSLHWEKALREYAEFTAACTNAYIEERKSVLPPSVPPSDEESKSDVLPAAERIYQTAYRLGAAVRRITGFREPADLRLLVFRLYAGIGIYLRGKLPGSFVVTDCFFSHFYSPEQCALMSAMDAGIIAGIFGGGRLEFSGRITEGCSHCSACFRIKR